MENKEEKPNYPEDRTEYELNCMNNKVGKAWTFYNLFTDSKKTAHLLSEAMNNGDKPDIQKHYNDFDKFNQGMRGIDKKYPCPSIHEWNEWYNKSK